MTIQLGYEEIRGLAKILGELADKKVSHTKVLGAIAQTLGRPMDGMMHALKNAKSQAEAHGCFADLIALLPKDERSGLPLYEDAAPIIEQMVRFAPVDTKSAVLRLKIDDLNGLAVATKLAKPQIVSAIAGWLLDALHWTTVVSLSEDEFVIVFVGVPLRDKIYDVLHGMENALAEGFELKPDEVTVVRFIGGVELLNRNPTYLEETLEEMGEFIEDVTPYRSGLVFAWNDSEGFDEF